MSISKNKSVIFNCTLCGKENTKTYRKDGAFAFCNRTCSGKYKARRINVEWDRSGKNNPAWKGGRKKNGAGYVQIYLPGHPFTHDHRKIYVFEHRLVMEKYIGRYLKPNERVHHVNGKRDDNRIENLVLFNGNSEHIKVAHPELSKAGFRGFIKKQKKATCGICRKEFIMNSPVHRYCREHGYRKDTNV